MARVSDFFSKESKSEKEMFFFFFREDWLE